MYCSIRRPHSPVHKQTMVKVISVASLVALLLCVCNAFGKSLAANTPPPIPAKELPANAIKIPLFRQATFYTCGVASLEACLYYWQVYDSTESVLAEECGTTEDKGTPPQNIVSVAQSYNLTSYMTENTTVSNLRTAVEDGWTVILDVQAWTDLPEPVDWKNDWEDGHYVVLVALDEQNVYIMDPSTGARYAYIPLGEFEHRWHDYTTLSNGDLVEFNHLAIFIRGDNPLLVSPPPMTYMA